jgi:PAS domain S-box-containing protein
VPEWGRILLGGVGCFLLAWISLELAPEPDGLPLWLADALLICLVLGQSGARLALTILAGVAGIFLAQLLSGAEPFSAGLSAAGIALSGVIARSGLARFAPAAAQLATAGALVRLLLWSAVLAPVGHALPVAAESLAAGDWLQAMFDFANWWCAAAAGSAVLLPCLLAFGSRNLSNPKLLQERWREALSVLALVALTAFALYPVANGLPLFLGIPLVTWAGLRFDFRSTSALALIVALISVLAADWGLWPLYWEATDKGVVRTLQAYLLAVILPALFASLLTQEQRATNAARLTALQALRAVMDAVPAAIVTLTPAGKVALWNRGAERVFGWRQGEVEGRDPPYVAPENAAEAASLRQRVLAGNEIQNQPIQCRNQAGETRELVVSAVPQRDADRAITGVIAVMEDVTDRRRLEASREEHRAHLAAVLDAVADPIITSDEEGTITSFSRAAEAAFGYAAMEVLGGNLRMLMPEPDRSQHDAYLRRYRETGIKRLIGTSRRVTAQRKDGGTFPAEITISEAWLAGRRILASIMRDLSQKPDATHPRPADPGLARFLSRITHDLRQPLHALSLMTGALERRTQDRDQREIVDDLSQTVRSIQAIFENIVDWTRLESGLIGATSATGSAGDILRSLAQEFEHEAARRGIAFRWVPARAAIACDPALVRRILRQLLDNAIKYAPTGKVLLGARRHGSTLRLIVADSGPGISADQHEFVFGAYHQLDAGREAGGIGLGLAIARRLAELAGLRLGIRSTPGRGSLFWLDVPLSGG